MTKLIMRSSYHYPKLSTTSNRSYITKTHISNTLALVRTLFYKVLSHKHIEPEPFFGGAGRNKEFEICTSIDFKLPFNFFFVRTLDFSFVTSLQLFCMMIVTTNLQEEQLSD